MKNVLNTLLVSSIILGGVTLGSVANAESTDPTAGHIKFNKGELKPDPGEPGKPGEQAVSVPTFDFGSFNIGEVSKGTTVKQEGEGSQSKGLSSTAVANYTGTDQAWQLSLAATEFVTEQLTPGRASSDSLTGITFDFGTLTATPKDGGDKLTNTLKEHTVETGKGSTPIFTTEAGEVAAGKFMMDYTETAMSMPESAASKAKPKAYTSTLTWKLELVGEAPEQALPMK